MSTRRHFFQVSALAAAALCIPAGSARAEGMNFPGIIYSAENPGKWAKKVATHQPQATVEGETVTVTTSHPMSAEHYIVRHTLVAADGTVLGEKTFQPTDKAVSTYTLPAGFKGQCWVTSFCNQHDFWVSSLEV